MMEPPDSQGSSRHKTYLLSGIDPGTVTVRWKVGVDARAVVVEESPQGLRDVAVLAVSQGVVPIDDRHAAAEHHHVVFSGIRHVLPQELIPPGGRSRRPSTARDVSASEGAMAGSTGITPGLLPGGDDFDLAPEPPVTESPGPPRGRPRTTRVASNTPFAAPLGVGPL